MYICNLKDLDFDALFSCLGEFYFINQTVNTPSERTYLQGSINENKGELQPTFTSEVPFKIEIFSVEMAQMPILLVPNFLL